MVRGDPEWARELRRQLALEIELVAGGYGAAAPVPDADAPDAASDRLNDLRRRLHQVERLIEAIEALHRDDDVCRHDDARGDAREDARGEAGDNDNDADAEGDAAGEAGDRGARYSAD